jgi:quercetin dioxygenase-like cupin family protein
MSAWGLAPAGAGRKPVVLRADLILIVYHQCRAFEESAGGSKRKESAKEDGMTLKIRRVVTGHDANGKAIVSIDEMCRNVISRRPNHASCVVWSSGEFPADNDGAADGGAREVATVDPNGTIFRLVEYGPGVTPRNHRTESIDYAIVLSGEIDMEMDGTMVHLKTGDVLVQRGTIHNWINRGTVPCVVAFVLVAAKPVERNGKLLTAHN